MEGGLIPANPTPWFRRFFAGYAAGMLRRSFAHVRVTADSAAAIERGRDFEGPVIAGMNHASWWDPLLALVISERLMGGRTLLSPMERGQLETFSFMRRLGIFGIDPDDPASLEAMAGYLMEQIGAVDRPIVGITPQGRFADVREAVRVRPGISVIASRAAERFGDVLVLAAAAEYTFWTDKKPELLVRLVRVEPPERPTAAGWHRAISRGMRSNQEALAAASIGREEAAFVPMLGGGGGAGRINPVYDLMLRLRGRSGEIRAVREAGRSR